MKRRYRQFCGVAYALDVLGERWTLLIVRNLLLGPRRYSDLLAELPGLTTNLLAARLKALEQEGIAVSGPRWQLTEKGYQLEPIVLELGRFGAKHYFSDAKKNDLRDIGAALFGLKRAYKAGALAGVLVELTGVGKRERVFEMTDRDGKLALVERDSPHASIRVRGSTQALTAWLRFGAPPDGLLMEGDTALLLAAFAA